MSCTENLLLSAVLPSLETPASNWETDREIKTYTPPSLFFSSLFSSLSASKQPVQHSGGSSLTSAPAHGRKIVLIPIWIIKIHVKVAFTASTVHKLFSLEQTVPLSTDLIYLIKALSTVM